MLLIQQLSSLFRPDILDPKFSLKQRVSKHDVALLSLGNTHAKLAQWNARSGIQSVKILERNDNAIINECKSLSPNRLMCVSLGSPTKLSTSKTFSNCSIAFGENNFVQAEFKSEPIPLLEETFKEFSILRIFPEPLALLYAIHKEFRPEQAIVATHNAFILAQFDVMGTCQAVSIFDPWEKQKIQPGTVVYRNSTFAGELRSDKRLSENLELEILCA